MTPTEKYEHFLQKTVVRGKAVRVSYFQEQGLGVFLEKLEAQGWLELFIDSKKGYSVPVLAEFYVNCVITNGVVTSTVNGRDIHFDASTLGTLLGLSAEGVGLYIREDKNVVGAERLLELTQRLAQKPYLIAPRFVRKGEMAPIN